MKSRVFLSEKPMFCAEVLASLILMYSFAYSDHSDLALPWIKCFQLVSSNADFQTELQKTVFHTQLVGEATKIIICFLAVMIFYRR